MKTQPNPSDREVLAGLVERVTYHNAENGFCVLRARARGHRDVVTVVGHAASISAGEWITASGDWVNDRTTASSSRRGSCARRPTRDGIEKYLSSGMIRDRSMPKSSCAPLARRSSISSRPHRTGYARSMASDRSVLRAFWPPGPNRRRCGRSWSSCTATASARPGQCGIFKTYGSDAIQVMSENPYRLARDIRGIGFKTADAIAMKLGIEKTAMIRVRAGISYALTEAMDEGHCGLPTDELVPLAEKLLEVPQQLIQTALGLELQDGTVIADRVGETPCVFLRWSLSGGTHNRRAPDAAGKWHTAVALDRSGQSPAVG